MTVFSPRWLTIAALCLFGATAPYVCADTAASAAPADISTLAQDIMSLNVLASLNLADAQIDQLLAVYRSPTPPAAPPAPATVKLLQGIREELIEGKPVDPLELTTAWQLIGRKRFAQAGPTLPDETADRILRVLTPAQLRTLMRPGGNRAGVRRGVAPQVEPILQRLKVLRDNGDDEAWARETHNLAASIAAEVGDEGSDAYKQECANLADFFHRVHGMNDKQFADGQKELLENLRALVPEGYSPGPAAVYTDVQKRTVVATTFAAPRMPLLLQEIKQARQGQ
jgi:hypothetical protein